MFVFVPSLILFLGFGLKIREMLEMFQNTRHIDLNGAVTDKHSFKIKYVIVKLM